MPKQTCRESREVPFFGCGVNVWSGYAQGVIESAEVDANGQFSPLMPPPPLAMPLPYQMQGRPGHVLQLQPQPSPSSPTLLRSPRSAPTSLPPVRRPLCGLDANILTMAREIGKLEHEKENLHRENVALKKQDARKTKLLTAFCNYYGTAPEA